jgi:nucleoside permease NupC
VARLEHRAAIDRWDGPRTASDPARARASCCWRRSANFFAFVERPVAILIDVSQAGTRFVFGPLLDVGQSFALGVLPIIVVVGSLFGTLYYLGWVQPFVHLTARFFAKTMKVSGAEALAAVANIFVGMTEAGLIVRPYLARMTRSELFSLMTSACRRSRARCSSPTR